MCDKSKSLYHSLARNEDYFPPDGCVPFEIDHYTHLENLEEDFNKLPFIESHNTVLPHLERRKILGRAEFDQEMIEQIKLERKEDFSYFGYPMEPPEHLVERKLFF